MGQQLHVPRFTRGKQKHLVRVARASGGNWARPGQFGLSLPCFTSNEFRAINIKRFLGRVIPPEV
jgi:hypothetical protein